MSIGLPPVWQSLHIPVRREDENLATGEVHAEELHEFLWLSGVLLPLEDLSDQVRASSTSFSPPTAGRVTGGACLAAVRF